MMDSVSENILKDAESAIGEFERGEMSLYDFARQMERPIQDARARDKSVELMLPHWAEIEIINALTLDDEREPDGEERRVAVQAARLLMEAARSSLA